MMKNWLLLVLTTVLFTACKRSADKPLDATAWELGKAAYAARSFDSAIAYFEQVAQRSPGIPAVYYNLGNAYYRSGQIAPAVLNYQRALRLQPGYQEAADNLAVAERRITNRIQPTQDIFFVRWWQSLTHFSHAQTWAVLSLLLFLALLGVIYLRMLRRPSWLPGQLVAGIGVLCACTILLSVVAAGKLSAHDSAVIMQQDTPLLGSPQPGKAQSYIPAGTTAEVLGSQGGYLETQLPDGRRGWIAQKDLTRI